MRTIFQSVLYFAPSLLGLALLATGHAAEPGSPAAELKASLSKALTLHASFDKGLEADFARGDKTCYVQQGKELVTAASTSEVQIAPEAGRFGGAIHFTKKNNFRPAFKDAGGWRSGSIAAFHPWTIPGI